MSALDQAIDDLTAKTAASRTVTASAVILINGFTARLDAAVAAALAAGATATELQALTDLSTAVKKDSDELAAAVSANTPAAP